MVGMRLASMVFPSRRTNHQNNCAASTCDFESPLGSMLATSATTHGIDSTPPTIAAFPRIKFRNNGAAEFSCRGLQMAIGSAPRTPRTPPSKESSPTKTQS